MTARKALTEDQAKLIRELGLGAEIVTFKKQGAALPCQVTVHTEGGGLRRWLYRDREDGQAEIGR